MALKICHLINTLSPAGAEGVVRDLVRYNDRDDISFTVCQLGGSTALASDIESAGTPVINFDAYSFYSPLLVARIVRYLAQTDFDILHAHLPNSHIVGRIAGTIAGIEGIVCTHHSVKSNYRTVSRINEYLTRPLGDVTVTVSDGVKTSFGKQDSDWRTIHNGINVDTFRKRVNEADIGSISDEFNSANLLFLNVSRYRDVKRQIDLIIAMEQVLKTIPCAHLVLVGWGPQESRLREAVSTRGLDEAVTITGRALSIEPYYAAADAFVLSSEQEGFGIVLLEAMAAGLAVVATDIPGVREVVADGTTGFLVPPRDPDALADALLRLREPTVRDEMGAAGYRRARKQFSIEQTVEAHCSLYYDLMS